MPVIDLGPDKLIGGAVSGSDIVFSIDMNEDITGKTVQLRFAELSAPETSVLTKTDGDGLTVTAATGNIAVNFTNTLDPGDYLWTLIVGNEDIWQGAFNSKQRTGG